jgi:hypothetical protein
MPLSLESIPSTTNSTGLELNSIFGNDKSNSFKLGYTHVLDDRNPIGADFPTVLSTTTGQVSPIIQVFSD